MNAPEITLLTIGVIALAADIIVRLVVMPERKDQMLEEILECMMEPEPSTAAGSTSATELRGGQERSLSLRAPVAVPEPVAMSLFRHFMQSSTSRDVLKALAAQEEGMSDGLVAAAVNMRLTERGKKPLPVRVVSRVVTILMGSDLVTRKRGNLALTDLGQELTALIGGGQASPTAAPPFASR